MVEHSQPVPGRAGRRGGRWLVQFAGVDSREGAEALAGAMLRAEPLTGAGGLVGPRADRLRGGRRRRGEPRRVTAVEANPASDLLVLDGGALVPLRSSWRRSPGS